MSGLQIVKLLNPIQMYIDGTFTPKGAYDNAVTYVVGDMVDYQGSSYILYNVSGYSAGTLPTNTTYWGVVAEKGATGATGATGPTGAGVATGGTTGQVLAKQSATDFDTDWETPTKSSVGLGNVDNTSDVNKPISSATQTALDAKVAFAAGTSVVNELPVWNNTTSSQISAFGGVGLDDAFEAAKWLYVKYSDQDSYLNMGVKFGDNGAFIDSDNMDFYVEQNLQIYAEEDIYIGNGQTLTLDAPNINLDGDVEFGGTVNLDTDDIGFTPKGQVTGSNITEAIESLDIKRKAEQRHESLRGWYAALADRQNTPAKMFMIGDSVTQGFAGPVIQNRIFGAYNNLTGGRYIAVSNTAGGQWSSWGGTRPNDYGPGGRGGTLSVGQEGVLFSGGVFDPNIDGVIIFYTKQETGGADLEIYIDDVLVDTISTTDAGVDGTESGFMWVSDELKYRVYKIHVKAVGSGTALVDGAISTASNRTTGVQIVNGGRSGATVPYFLDATGVPTLQSLKNFEPDLVTIFLGINDYGDGAALYKTRLAELVDKVRDEAPLTSVMLVAPYRSHSGRVNTVLFSQAAAEVAAEKNCYFVSLFRYMGNIGSDGDEYNLASDTVHPNIKGINMIADAMASPLIDNRPSSSTTIMSDGSRPMTSNFVLRNGSLSAEYVAGSAVLGAVFGLPVLSISTDDEVDDPGAIVFERTLGTALGLGGPGIGFGGGAALPDSYIYRTGAAALRSNSTFTSTNLFTSNAETYTITNTTTRRTIDKNDTTVNELVDLVGTLINDLKAGKLPAGS